MSESAFRARLSGRNSGNQGERHRLRRLGPGHHHQRRTAAAAGERRDPPLVRVCKEDEGVGICAGLAHTNKRALLLIQQTGLLNSINAIRGVAVEYSLPVCMMVGLLEKEPGVPPRQSKRYGVRIVEPILEAMGIAYHEIEKHADVHKISPRSTTPMRDSQPVVLLIGRRPT